MLTESKEKYLFLRNSKHTQTSPSTNGKDPTALLSGKTLAPIKVTVPSRHRDTTVTQPIEVHF